MSEQKNVSVPDGWKLVPIKPTIEMLEAGSMKIMANQIAGYCYRSMLAAAPSGLPQAEQPKMVDTGSYGPNSLRSQTAAERIMEQEDKSQREFDSKRLRRVVNLLGLSNAVPDGDLSCCIGAVLGMVARKIEEMQAEQPQSQAALQSLVDQAQELDMGYGMHGGEAWVIAKQIVVDGGTSHKQLAYKVHADFMVFNTKQAAIKALRKADLPLGWVVISVNELPPDFQPHQPSQRESSNDNQ
jgi:hypothetical protein